MRRTKSNSLSAYWSKRESEILYCHPEGPQTSADGHFLYAALGRPLVDLDTAERSIRQELESRGYDITTLRFSICKKEGHERWK